MSIISQYTLIFCNMYLTLGTMIWSEGGAEELIDVINIDKS